MATFNNQLEKIHSQVTVKDEDRKPYTELFDTVREWLMKEMRDIDPLFNELSKGTNLFGSYSNNVRIIKPSEFDVSVLLEFNFPIIAHLDASRPGFALLSSDCWKKVDGGNKYDKLLDGNFISTTKLQEWIEKLIQSVTKTRPLSPKYKVDHNLCKTAHKFKVDDVANQRTISFDFVPSIVMKNFTITPPEKNTQANQMHQLKTFLAVPNYSEGIEPELSGLKAFQIVNPTEEQRLLWDKKNLKSVYRLLKSLRDKQNLPRLKSYFLTAIFLLEVGKQNEFFWNKSIGELFIHMLKTLVGHFQTGNLPYYWDRDFNLLTVLTKNQISDYHRILNDVFCKLQNISLRSSGEYSEADSFFCTSEDDK